MANPNAPFGFAESHRLGAAPNYQNSRRYISPTYGTSLFFGDPVISLAGYVTQGTPAAIGSGGGPNVCGIFIGCEYMSISQKKWIPNMMWTGGGADAVNSGSGFDVWAKVIDDPETVFRVQANGIVTQAMVGLLATYVNGTGSTATGRSGAMLDITTNAPTASPPTGTNLAYPFKIVDLVRDPPETPGADITTAYNWAYVTFNQQTFRAVSGSATIGN